jgi:hypothetical protein
VANVNEAQIESRQATQSRGQVIGYSRENVILLIRVPCEMFGCCGVLAFKAEKDELLIIAVYCSHFSSQNTKNEKKERNGQQ